MKEECEGERAVREAGVERNLPHFLISLPNEKQVYTLVSGSLMFSNNTLFHVRPFLKHCVHHCGNTVYTIVETLCTPLLKHCVHPC